MFADQDNGYRQAKHAEDQEGALRKISEAEHNSESGVLKSGRGGFRDAKQQTGGEKGEQTNQEIRGDVGEGGEVEGAVEEGGKREEQDAQTRAERANKEEKCGKRG